MEKGMPILNQIYNAHGHFPILNEIYIAKKGDVCVGCGEQLDSCKSFVYSCSKMVSTSNTNTSATTYDADADADVCDKLLLHKTCAELTPKIVNPTNQKEFLFFAIYFSDDFDGFWCDICKLKCTWFFYYNSSYSCYVCFKCALFQVEQCKEETTFVHPSHSHPLAVIQHPSSFRCSACKVNDNILELSYICIKCQFWMHKSCGDAPPSFQSPFHHNHPLILLFSLPQLYCKFPQYCRICYKKLSVKEWLYCCCSCRFFTHFHCARSSPMLRSSEDETYPNLVHLPPADESSLNRLLDQFLKDMITQYNSCNSMSIVSTGNFINHWSHKDHDLKLISINDRENDDEILLLCDGCVRPIGTDHDSLFYSCVSCNYFLHKVCAELPREIENHLYSPGKTLFAIKLSQPFYFLWCVACRSYGNGIFFSDEHFINYLHIGCVNLPKIIKHQVHPHQLDQVHDRREHSCNSCGSDPVYFSCKYRCEKCNFYICGRCIMSTRTIKHTWDRHPLDLIYDAGMVTNHEHDYNCEYCSEDINTNHWFYHCSICDLSFHIHECLEKSRYGSYKYKHVKFGASDIKRDKLHPHRLTLVLNKKVRNCGLCNRTRWPGKPVLQCAPCNTIFCRKCWSW